MKGEPIGNLKFAICSYKFAVRLSFLGMLLPCAIAGPATAQNYSFSVPKLQMFAAVQPDASAKIDYVIEFHNNPGAHPIDIVDIGTPHSGYRLSDIRAWIDDQPLHDIRPSTAISVGFEVHLDNGTIMPGRTGKLQVVFTMPKMVFQDTTRKDYASMRITPTWFGDQYVTGNTHIQIMILLPKDVKPEEVLYQDRPFNQKALTKDGVMVYWQFPTDRLTHDHLVGVSFPKGNIQVVKQTALDLLLNWFSESPQARWTCGAIFLVLFAILFFRFSGGTGFSVFFILSGLACICFYFYPGWHLISMPVVVVLIGLNEWLLGERKMHYMPPIAQVEGGGIKRGLTAPEAAVLLELPVAKVLGLVIFGMLKKGILRQTGADPLSVAVNDNFQLKAESDQSPPTKEQHTQFYRDAAQKNGIVVHSYEEPFLFLLENNPGKPVKDINFGVPMRQLIDGAAAGCPVSISAKPRIIIARLSSRRPNRPRPSATSLSARQRLTRISNGFLWTTTIPRCFTGGRISPCGCVAVQCRCPAPLLPCQVPCRASRGRLLSRTWLPLFRAGPRTRWAAWPRPLPPARWAQAHRRADFSTSAARTTLPAKYFRPYPTLPPAAAGATEDLAADAPDAGAPALHLRRRRTVMETEIDMPAR